MNKRIALAFVVIAVAFVLYYVSLFLVPQKTRAPENQNPTSVNFKGPTGMPYVKGPTAPPPGR